MKKSTSRAQRPPAKKKAVASKAAAEKKKEQKVPAKKTRTKTAATKKATAKKTRTKTAATKKATARKTGKKKSSAKKASARKTTRKKATEKKTTRKKVGQQEVERRAHARHDKPYEIKVNVELHGYLRDGRELGIGPMPDRSRQFATSGVTLNVSRGGMLARVESVVAEGNHCLVRFVGTGGHIRPELRWGLVLRSTPTDGGCEVAVTFDSPLEVLEQDDLAAITS